MVGSARLEESYYHTISPNTPAHSTNPWNKSEREIGKKRASSYYNKKGIGFAFETRESHIIEYGVTKIVPQGY